MKMFHFSMVQIQSNDVEFWQKLNGPSSSHTFKIKIFTCQIKK